MVTQVDLQNSLLTFGLFLRETRPELLRHKIMPLQLSTRPLPHSRLESPELCNSLQLLDRLNCLLQEISIRIALRSFIHDSLKRDRVFLEMLGRTAEEMLEVETMGVWVPSTLLVVKVHISL